MFRVGHNQPGRGLGGDTEALAFGLGNVARLLVAAPGKVFKAASRSTTWLAAKRETIWPAAERRCAWRKT